LRIKEQETLLTLQEHDAAAAAADDDDELFSPENRAFYVMIWKNLVEPGTYVNVAHALCLLDK